MPIPNNILREHILQSIKKIKREGIPTGRASRVWALHYEGENYPCKLVISWANIYANGEELDPDPNNFQTYMAQDYLKALGFSTVQID